MPDDSPENPSPEADETFAAPSLPRSPSEAHSHAGTMVGRYRIVEKIGEGGMGLVFEAEQEKPRRRVALKMIRGGRLADDLSVRLFEREAEILGRLEHPGIAAIYEAGRAEDGHYFLAMELVRGRTFDAYLRERPRELSKEELRHRLRLFIDVCDAVHYAHQRGVIHRDLKPSNIVVADSGDAAPHVKILDFGLARMADPTDADAAALSRTGSIRGTLAYMSPEQVSGNPNAVDIRSDVYSLGIVLYQMISGALPYEVTGSSILEAARTITATAPKPLASLVGKSAIDTDLQTIVAKALEKEPDSRYSSAAALRDDVERYLSDQPILARPPSTSYQLRKLIARNRLPFLVGACVFGLVIAFGVVMSFLYRRSEANLARAIGAERKAATEAGTAQQVSGFLTDLFEVSNPEESRGNQVTARELLDQGAQKIRTQLADRPDVQARLMRTMGAVYSNLGLYKEAQDLLVQSTARTAALEKAEGLSELAKVQNHLGQNEDARRSLESALEAEQRELKPDAYPVLRDRILLAGILNALGRYEESRALFERALPELERTLGPESTNLATARNKYGNLLSDLGDKKGALAQYQRSLEAMEKALPPDHPLVAELLQNVATIYEETGAFERAKEPRLRSLAIQEKVLGKDHPKTLANRENLAMLYSQTGDRKRALEIFEENVQRWERMLGPQHPNVAQALNNLGYTLYLMGRFEPARVPLERALRVRRASLGEEHLSTNLTRYNLANVYTALGRYSEARPLLLRVIETDVKLMGENTQDVVDDLQSYADLLKKAGDKREAKAVEARMAAIRAKLKAEPAKPKAPG